MNKNTGANIEPKAEKKMTLEEKLEKFNYFELVGMVNTLEGDIYTKFVGLT